MPIIAIIIIITEEIFKSQKMKDHLPIQVH